MKQVLISILVMSLTTYLIRMLPLVIFRKKITNVYIKSFMEYVPVVVLSCMTFPAIFTCTQNTIASIFGSVVAIILGFMNRSLVEVAVVAVCCVLLVSIMMG